VYFYPKSFTSVCTEEAHLFAEAMPEFETLGSSVIGISADTIETQREFSRTACRDKFPVAADPQGKIVKAYDVLAWKEGDSIFASRTSYIHSRRSTQMKSPAVRVCTAGDEQRGRLLKAKRETSCKTP
jgi:peroxiredoxin